MVCWIAHFNLRSRGLSDANPYFSVFYFGDCVERIYAIRHEQAVFEIFNVDRARNRSWIRANNKHFTFDFVYLVCDESTRRAFSAQR